jgi:glycosyltransferase involved in cell wall biosynthesis
VKIVFLSPASGGGGAEEVLFDLVAGLKAINENWRLHIICGEAGPLVGRLQSLKVETELIPFPSAFLAYGEQPTTGIQRKNRVLAFGKMLQAAAYFFIYSLKLRRRLRQLNPDVIHSNGMKMHLVSALASSRNAAIVWHLHDYLGMRRTTSRLLPRLSSRIRLTLANSRSVARDAQALFPKTRVEVLENSVDLGRFRPEGARLDLDRLSGLAETAPGVVKVGLVATFARWKGQDLFLRAIACLPKDLPARFYIIGGPVYATPGSQWRKKELVEAAAPVANRIGLTGWTNDAASALRALDIVVHASIKPEPFGLVIIQAMACGKAVIVSGEGGAAEVVEGQPDAVTFIPRDPQSLADAMLLLITHPERRKAARVSGPATVRKRFDRTRMASLAGNYLRSLVPDVS